MSIDPLTGSARKPPLVEQLEQDQAAIAAGAEACGASCACHGNAVCARTAHPHDVDDAHPHVGYGPDGQLVQWVHTEQHGPVLTDEQVAEQAAAARREHTRSLLGTLDLDELRAALERHTQRMGGTGASLGDYVGGPQ